MSEMIETVASAMVGVHLGAMHPDDADYWREKARAAIEAYIEISDDPVMDVYRRILWFHMDALRKGDEAKRARIFGVAEVMRELWPDEINEWESRYPVSAALIT